MKETKFNMMKKHINSTYLGWYVYLREMYLPCRLINYAIYLNISTQPETSNAIIAHLASQPITY